MPLNPNGEFSWEVRALDGGIRQDLAESMPRFTAVKNAHLFRRPALTKRLGYRRLNTVDITGTPEIWAGFDCHFNDGTQKVIVVGATDAYLFANATRSFTAQSQSLTNARPDLLMFNNELILVNGTEQKRWDGTTWNNLSGTPPEGAYAAVHANRLILAGDTTLPYQFFYSGVRNPNSWATSTDYVTVTAPFGETITALGSLGPFLIVCTRSATIAYIQNAGNPGDWDRFDISLTVGAINNASFLEVEHLSARLAFFWSADGPMVLFRSGNTVAIKPLWEPAFKVVQGVDDAPMDGLEVSRFSSIVAGYQSDIQEIKFSATNVGDAENNVTLCYDLKGVIAYATGGADQPKITLKDNENTAVYPCDALFQIRVGTDGLPSTTGLPRLFSGRNGIIYELDKTNADSAETIPLTVVLDGLSGAEDGIGDYQKVVNKVRVRGRARTNNSITAQVSADGGASSGTATLNLDSSATKWGQSTWGGGKWGGAIVKQARGDVGVYGKTFKVKLTDGGSITRDFDLTSITLEGVVLGKD